MVDPRVLADVAKIQGSVAVKQEPSFIGTSSKVATTNEKDTVLLPDGVMISKSDYESLPPKLQQDIMKEGYSAIEEYNKLVRYINAQNIASAERELEEEAAAYRDAADKTASGFYNISKTHIEVFPGEWIDKSVWSHLPKDLQSAVKTFGSKEGAERYALQQKALREVEERELETTHVQIRPGEWIPKEVWETLSKEEMALARSKGIEAVNKLRAETSEAQRVSSIAIDPKQSIALVELENLGYKTDSGEYKLSQAIAEGKVKESTLKDAGFTEEQIKDAKSQVEQMKIYQLQKDAKELLHLQQIQAQVGGPFGMPKRSRQRLEELTKKLSTEEGREAYKRAAIGELESYVPVYGTYKLAKSGAPVWQVGLSAVSDVLTLAPLLRPSVGVLKSVTSPIWRPVAESLPRVGFVPLGSTKSIFIPEVKVGSVKLPGTAKLYDVFQAKKPIILPSVKTAKKTELTRQLLSNELAKVLSSKEGDSKLVRYINTRTTGKGLSSIGERRFSSYNIITPTFDWQVGPVSGTNLFRFTIPYYPSGSLFLFGEINPGTVSVPVYTLTGGHSPLFEPSLARTRISAPPMNLASLTPSLERLLREAEIVSPRTRISSGGIRPSELFGAAQRVRIAETAGRSVEPYIFPGIAPISAPSLFPAYGTFKITESRVKSEISPEQTVKTEVIPSVKTATQVTTTPSISTITEVRAQVKPITSKITRYTKPTQYREVFVKPITPFNPKIRPRFGVIIPTVKEERKKEKRVKEMKRKDEKILAGLGLTPATVTVLPEFTFGTAEPVIRKRRTRVSKEKVHRKLPTKIVIPETIELRQ